MPLRPATPPLPSFSPAPLQAPERPAGSAKRTAIYLSVALLPIVLSGCAPVIVLGEGMAALVHELGHTVVSIFFGKFALPLIVITLSYEQSRIVAAIVNAALLYGAWKLRSQPLLCGILAVAAVLYGALAFTHGHETAIALAGHGAEIASAAVFFMFAAGGGLVAEGERPGWAAFGGYLAFRNLSMGWKLATSAIFRETYASVSFTGGDNDFTTAATALGTTVVFFAWVQMIASVAAVGGGIAIGLVRGRRLGA